MTQENKEQYIDAVIYLRQYAKSCKNNETMCKFCYDIQKKALFIASLKPKLFNIEKIKEELFEYDTEKYHYEG